MFFSLKRRGFIHRVQQQILPSRIQAIISHPFRVDIKRFRLYMECLQHVTELTPFGTHKMGILRGRLCL